MPVLVRMQEAARQERPETVLGVLETGGPGMLLDGGQRGHLPHVYPRGPPLPHLAVGRLQQTRALDAMGLPDDGSDLSESFLDARRGAMRDNLSPRS